MHEQIRRITSDSTDRGIGAQKGHFDLSNYCSPPLSEAGAEVRSELTPSSPSVVLYHSTPLSNFTSIIRNGLFLSTKDWTVSTVPIGMEAKGVVFIVFRVAQERLNEMRLTSDGLKTSIPEDVRAYLKLWDKFYLSQDAYYSTTAKPEWLRFKVSRAHNLLHSEQEGTLTHIPVNCFDVDKMLEINKGREGFELIQKELTYLGGSKDTPEPSKYKISRIQDILLQIAGTLYNLIPKRETRAFKEHLKRDASIEKIRAKAKNL